MRDRVKLQLVIPAKRDLERDAVAAAWESAGGGVVRLDRFWEPPVLDPAAVRVYGGESFCLVLAELLHLELVSPPDFLLAELPEALLGRVVRVVELANIGACTFPLFCKPVQQKSFVAGVFESAADLSARAEGLSPDSPLLVSDVVRFVAEARAWLLGGEVAACAVYAGQAEVGPACRVAATVARRRETPVTCVIDVGLVPGRGWVVVEANPSWGSGLNGCDAQSVVACIAEASRVAA